MENDLPPPQIIFITEECLLQPARRSSLYVLIYISSRERILNFNGDGIDWYACDNFQDISVINILNVFI